MNKVRLLSKGDYCYDLEGFLKVNFEDLRSIAPSIEYLMSRHNKDRDLYNTESNYDSDESHTDKKTTIFYMLIIEIIQSQLEKFGNDSRIVLQMCYIYYHGL